MTASRDSTANVKAPRTFGNTPDTQFSTFLAHTWLSQAFLVNKHLSRRCLCTTQHCRDRCNVLLTSQPSFKCRILSRQRIHLLLQRSNCIFHFWDRVGSHARVESSMSKGFHGQHSATRGPQQLRDSHKLSATRDFASRPPTSSTPVQTTTDKLRSFSKQGTGKTQDSATLRCHVCKVCAVCTRCRVSDFDLTSGLWIVHHDDDVQHTLDNAISHVWLKQTK